MANSDDLNYVRRVKAGEINAFSHLVSNYQRMVLTIVLRIVNNMEDAEDITQEVFIKVFRSIDAFKEESEFSTWLYRIAYNTTLSELRKRRIVFSSFEDQLSNLRDEEIGEEIDDISTEERIEHLNQAMKCLPPDEVMMVTLFYMDDQSIDKISQITNLSQANVKVKLHRIRKKLAVEINKLMAK